MFNTEYEYQNYKEEELMMDLEHAKEWMPEVIRQLTSDEPLDKDSLYNALEEVCAVLDVDMPLNLSIKRAE